MGDEAHISRYVHSLQGIRMGATARREVRLAFQARVVATNSQTEAIAIAYSSNSVANRRAASSTKPLLGVVG